MADRITRAVLQRRLDVINRMFCTAMQLDYAKYYGGYCLTSYDGSRHLCLRMQPRELMNFMDGMLLADQLRNLE